MTIAGFFFRAGYGGISFLISYAFCLLLALMPQLPCTKPDSDPFFAALALGVLLALLTAFLGISLPLRRVVRWFALPLVLLVPLAFKGVLPFFQDEAIATMHVCSASKGWAAASSTAGWHSAWAALQTALLLALGVQSIRFWRKDSAQEE